MRLYITRDRVLGCTEDPPTLGDCNLHFRKPKKSECGEFWLYYNDDAIGDCYETSIPAETIQKLFGTVPESVDQVIMIELQVTKIKEIK